MKKKKKKKIARIGKEVWFISNYLSLKFYEPMIEGAKIIGCDKDNIKIRPYNCEIGFVLTPFKSNYWGFLPK